jgi:hypothetical protein
LILLVIFNFLVFIGENLVKVLCLCIS